MIAELFFIEEQSEQDDFLDIVLDRLQALVDKGLRGFSGQCGHAAIKINKELFNNSGIIVAAANKYLWESQKRLVGHVAVYWPTSDSYWDVEGEKSWDEIESWGMLDPSDPDWNLPSEDDAYEVVRLELSPEEVMKYLYSCEID